MTTTGQNRLLRTQRELEAVASSDPDAIAAVLRGHAPHLGEREVVLRGLLLLGGRGDVPFSPNPWGISASYGLDEALSRVWLPVAERCPQFLAAVRREIFGLALVEASGEFSLAYLFLRCFGRRASSSAPRSLDALLSRAEEGARLEVMWGERPFPPDSPPISVLDVSVPAAIQALAGVHTVLRSPESHLQFTDSGGETLGDLLRERNAEFYEEDVDEEEEEEEDWQLADLRAGVFDRCIYLGHCDEAAEGYYYDLGNGRPSPDPLVVTHDQDGSSHGDSLLEWFDRRAQELLLCVPSG
ncbi:hypothetical protein [Actinomadura geliboluensis]|uniref:hypothetical protein n=1 Tax=Actinomadura geliboluensis TaxID=882440 RepID=UPI0037244333